MGITLEISDNEDSKWNSRLLESNLGTIYQSKEMKINFENQGFSPKFLKFYDEKGSIIGQLLYSEITTSFDKNKVKQILKRVIKSKTLCQWSYGPIVFDNKYTNEIFSKLGEFLLKKDYCVSGTEHPFLPSRISGLEKKFQFVPWSTFIIDLRLTKDFIYKNIAKHNGRKNIERSIKRKVIVEEINEKSLTDYYQLYVNMQKKAGKPNAYQNFEALLEWWNLFKPLGYSGFLAKRNDEAIGGLLFSYMNDHIIEGGVVRSEIDKQQNLYSQDLIKWNIIEWGIKNKKLYYNFAGFNPQPKSDKEIGIMQYKKKWGGKQYDYWIIKR